MDQGNQLIGIQDLISFAKDHVENAGKDASGEVLDDANARDVIADLALARVRIDQAIREIMDYCADVRSPGGSHG